MLCACLALSTYAQETKPLVGKKGQPILPEAKDIGLGVNLIPFFNWFGNSFNGTTDNLSAASNKFFTIFGNSVLMGKYMLTDKTAVRAHFGFNVGSVTDGHYVRNDNSINPSDLVLDTRKGDNGHYTLALGYEMRRGKRRIQGYFGGDLILRVDHSSGYTYTYGNSFSATNQNPTSHNFPSNNLLGGTFSSQRVLTDGGRTIFGVGLRGFIGVEYFVAPKVSCGVEFGWGLTVNAQFESIMSIESYDFATSGARITDVKNAAVTSFSAGVDNMNGAVFMLFYF